MKIWQSQKFKPLLRVISSIVILCFAPLEIGCQRQPSHTAPILSLTGFASTETSSKLRTIEPTEGIAAGELATKLQEAASAAGRTPQGPTSGEKVDFEQAMVIMDRLVQWEKEFKGAGEISQAVIDARSKELVELLKHLHDWIQICANSCLQALLNRPGPISPGILPALEGVLETNGLPYFSYRDANRCIRIIKKRAPDLIKPNSLAAVAAELPPSVIGHNLVHYQMYLNRYFKEATKGLSAPAQYSLGLSAYRLLKRYNLEINDTNITQAIDLVLKKREETAPQSVFSKGRKVINLAHIHTEPELDLKQITYLEQRAGVEHEDIISHKGPDTKQQALKDISGSTGRLTILFNVHGSPNHLWLSSGEVGSETLDNLANPLAISYKELGDALIQRGDAGEVIILIEACRSYNFCFNLLNYLSDQGVTKPPIVVSSGNLDSSSYRGVFIKSLTTVHSQHVGPLTMRDVFEAEGESFKLEDSAIFVPITEEEIRKYFPTAKLTVAVATQVSATDHLPSSALELSGSVGDTTTAQLPSSSVEIGFKPLTKPGATEDLGEAIGKDLIFDAVSKPEVIISDLEAKGITISDKDKAKEIIPIIQRYFKTIRIRAPDKTKDISSYQIEFRRNVLHYVALEGNKIILDIDLLNLNLQNPQDLLQDLLPFLTFVLGHEGSHAEELAGSNEQQAQKIDIERFKSFSPHNQRSVLNILRQLKADESYIKSLEEAARISEAKKQEQKSHPSLLGTFSQAPMSDKGRFVFPLPWRHQLAAGEQFVLELEPKTGIIRGYYESDWIRRAQGRGARSSAQGEETHRSTIIDSYGRIELPKMFRDRLSFGSSVTVAGCGDYFEIWPAGKYESSSQTYRVNLSGPDYLPAEPSVEKQFLGEDTVTIDAKYKFLVHSQWRKLNGPQIVLQMIPGQNKIRLFSLADFERIAKKNLPRGQGDQQAYRRAMYGSAWVVEPDEQGRVLMPHAIRGSMPAGTSLKLTGHKSYVEISIVSDAAAPEAAVTPPTRERGNPKVTLPKQPLAGVFRQRSLDNKGRFTVPLKLRNKRPEEHIIVFELVPGQKIIRGYFASDWDRIAKQDAAKGIVKDDATYLYSAFEVQNRVVIPRAFKDKVPFGDSVTIVARGDYFEIWPAAAYASRADKSRPPSNNQERMEMARRLVQYLRQARGGKDIDLEENIRGYIEVYCQMGQHDTASVERYYAEIVSFFEAEGIYNTKFKTDQQKILELAIMILNGKLSEAPALHYGGAGPASGPRQRSVPLPLRRSGPTPVGEAGDRGGFSPAEATIMCGIFKQVGVIPSYTAGIDLRQDFSNPENSGIADALRSFKHIFDISEIKMRHSFEVTCENVTEAEKVKSSPFYSGNCTYHPKVVNGQIINLADPLIGEAEGLIGNPESELYKIVRTLNPTYVSLHLAWSAEEIEVASTAHNDRALSPVLDRRVLLERIVANLNTLQANLKRAGYDKPILVETLDYEGTGALEYVTEPEFVQDVLKRTGARLLIGCSHLLISAKNNGLYQGNPFMEYVKKMVNEDTIGLIDEIHLAVPEAVASGYKDTHNPFYAASSAAEEVKEILRYIFELRRQNGVTHPVIVNFETGVGHAQKELEALAEELEKVGATPADEPGGAKGLLIEAHRGKIRVDSPENTLEAFRESANDPRIDLIELDLQLTKDGKFVVVHEAGKGISTPDGPKLIRDLTLEQIKQRQPNIPSFDEALAVLIPSGKKLDLDIKDFGRESAEDADLILNRLLPIIRDNNLTDRVYCASFNFALLRRLKAIAPELKVMYDGEGVVPTDRTVVTDIENARSIGASFITMPYESYTSFVAEEVRKSGIPLYIYLKGGLSEALRSQLEGLSKETAVVVSTDNAQAIDGLAKVRPSAPGEGAAELDKIKHSPALERTKNVAGFRPVLSETDSKYSRYNHIQRVTEQVKKIAGQNSFNLELAEAIALGHDLARPAFAAIGERALKKLLKESKFDRGKNILRVLEGIGIAKDSLAAQEIVQVITKGAPQTREGQLVLAVDTVIGWCEDTIFGVEAGYIRQDEIPQQAVDLFGSADPNLWVESIVKKYLKITEHSVSIEPEILQFGEETYWDGFVRPNILKKVDANTEGLVTEAVAAFYSRHCAGLEGKKLIEAEDKVIEQMITFTDKELLEQVPPAAAPGEGEGIDKILVAEINFDGIEEKLFPYDSLPGEEKHLIDKKIADDSTLKMGDDLSREADMVMEQRQYPYAFEPYRKEYYLSKEGFLDARNMLLTAPVINREELEKKLIEQYQRLIKAISKIVLYNNIQIHPRYFYVNNGAGVERIDDSESRRYSYSGGAIWYMLHDADIKEGDVILEPFAGPGNLLAFLTSYTEPSRIIACDVAYGFPKRGERTYAIRENLREFQSLFGFLPDILRPKLRDVEFIRGDSTNIALVDSSVDKIFTDPPYGREGYLMNESEAFVIFIKAVRESNRILKPNGEARFGIPSEWAKCLEYFMRTDLSNKTPKEMYDEFYNYIKDSPFYKKKNIAAEYKFVAKDWEEIKEIIQEILKDPAMFDFEIVEIKPWFFFPMSIIKLSKVPKPAPPSSAPGEGEGKCVSADTLLPIMSEEILSPKSEIRNNSLMSKFPMTETKNFRTFNFRFGASDLKLKPIVEVKPGDYVLSLNEETGKVEPHRINGLLDMGVKPVYKLTTLSGRSIKTTANHPYLTKEGWVKVSQLKVGDEIGAPKEINDCVLSLYADDIQSRPWIKGLPELLKQLITLPLFFTSLFRENGYAYKNKQNAYNTNSNSPENGKFFKEITGQSHHKNSFTQISYGFGNKLYSFLMQYFHPQIIYHGLKNLSRFIYSDGYAYAQPVLENDIGWDKIISIEYIGYEHVYDIEVEGTHNFIGNGIFAHNTYIEPAPGEGEGKTGKNTTKPPGAATSEQLKEWSKPQFIDDAMKFYTYVFTHLIDDYTSKIRGKKVLDIGTGLGLVAIWAKQNGAADVTGIDPDPESLDFARKNAKERNCNINFEQGNATALRFNNGEFDVVTAGRVFWCLSRDEKRETLKQMLRVTKEDGYILIVDYHDAVHEWNDQIADYEKHHTMPRQDEYWTEEKWKSELSAAGFTDIACKWIWEDGHRIPMSMSRSKLIYAKKPVSKSADSADILSAPDPFKGPGGSSIFNSPDRKVEEAKRLIDEGNLEEARAALGEAIKTLKEISPETHGKKASDAARERLLKAEEMLRQTSPAVAPGEGKGWERMSGAKLTDAFAKLQSEWNVLLIDHSFTKRALPSADTFSRLEVAEVLIPKIREDIERAEKSNKQLVYVISAGQEKDVAWLLKELAELIPEEKRDGWTIEIVVTNLNEEALSSAKRIISNSNLPIHGCYLNVDILDTPQIDSLTAVLSKYGLLGIVDGIMQNLGRTVWSIGAEVPYVRLLRKWAKEGSWFQIERPYLFRAHFAVLIDKEPSEDMLKDRDQMQSITNCGFRMVQTSETGVWPSTIFIVESAPAAVLSSDRISDPYASQPFVGAEAKAPEDKPVVAIDVSTIVNAENTTQTLTELRNSYQVVLVDFTNQADETRAALTTSGIRGVTETSTDGCYDKLINAANDETKTLPDERNKFVFVVSVENKTQPQIDGGPTIVIYPAQAADEMVSLRKALILATVLLNKNDKAAWEKLLEFMKANDPKQYEELKDKNLEELVTIEAKPVKIRRNEAETKD